MSVFGRVTLIRKLLLASFLRQPSRVPRPGAPLQLSGEASIFRLLYHHFGFFSFIAYFRLALVASGVPFFRFDQSPYASRSGLTLRPLRSSLCDVPCLLSCPSANGPTMASQAPRDLRYFGFAAVSSVFPSEFVSAFVPSFYLSWNSRTQLA